MKPISPESLELLRLLVAAPGGMRAFEMSKRALVPELSVSGAMRMLSKLGLVSAVERLESSHTWFATDAGRALVAAHGRPAAPPARRVRVWRGLTGMGYEGERVSVTLPAAPWEVAQPDAGMAPE